MDPASLALSIVGLTDVCLQSGRALLKKYRSYRDADREVGELILLVDDHWLKMQEEFKYLQRIWNVFDSTHQDHLHRVIMVLHSIWEQANVTINSILGEKSIEMSLNNIALKDGVVKRGKYALRVKDSLKRTTADLQTWHGILKDGLFLMTLNKSSIIDGELKYAKPKVENGKTNPVFAFKSLRDRVHHGLQMPTSLTFLPESVLHTERINMPFTSTRIATLHTGNSLVLTDTIRYRADDDLDQVTTDVRSMANVLACDDVFECGLLPCCGVIKRMENARDVARRSLTFEFIFRAPSLAPQCLRSVLIAGIELPLNERFQLATLLAKSVMYVHDCKFVHKNIRPDTIICFQSGDHLLGTPFLLGFEKFRPAAGKTSHRSDNLWENNLYRHPQRQGKKPEEDYTMQHDIYSVGVILLEIGLWNSFVQPSGERMDEFAPGPVLNISSLLRMSDQRKSAIEIKDRLVGMAKDRLPFRMGQRYTDIVVDCLTCLDDDNAFGSKDEFKDADGIEVGVRYIEKILQQLQEITI
ncbi:MAG: hypothetical protein LQ342_003630 [Letrouitia transgressa]|nr:MAG: hypothetical protein LQ342_003630 [Letrouitia transgressa]